MKLGTFSISLAVKNLAASKTFYQTLGFTVFHGDEEQGWLILKNEGCTLGLFQGMFEKNIMTFNPGWNANAEEVNPFTDVREIQEKLKSAGVKIEKEITEDSGPASFQITDPDGNQILFDQHR